VNGYLLNLSEVFREHAPFLFSSANTSVLYATISHFSDIQSFEQLRDKLAYVISDPKRHGLDEKSKMPEIMSRCLSLGWRPLRR